MNSTSTIHIVLLRELKGHIWPTFTLVDIHVFSFIYFLLGFLKKSQQVAVLKLTSFSNAENLQQNYLKW